MQIEPSGSNSQCLAEESHGWSEAALAAGEGPVRTWLPKAVPRSPALPQGVVAHCFPSTHSCGRPPRGPAAHSLLVAFGLVLPSLRCCCSPCPARSARAGCPRCSARSARFGCPRCSGRSARFGWARCRAWPRVYSSQAQALSWGRAQCGNSVSTAHRSGSTRTPWSGATRPRQRTRSRWGALRRRCRRAPGRTARVSS